MRHSAEVSTQTACQEESEIGARRKVKTEHITCIKQEPIEEVSVQLMDLQDLAPDPICLVQSDEVPANEQTEDFLIIEPSDSSEQFADLSLDGSLEVIDTQDPESSDTTPEVIGFAASGTDYVSEETIDDFNVPSGVTEVAMNSAEVPMETPDIVQQAAKVAEVSQVVCKTRPPVFEISVPWVGNLVQSRMAYKTVEPPPQVPLVVAKQKRKSSHLIRNNCDGKKPATEISNTCLPTKEPRNVQTHVLKPVAPIRKIVVTAQKELGPKKFSARILQKISPSTVAVMQVNARRPRQRTNLIPVLKVPLVEVESEEEIIVPALRDDAADWEKE